MLQGQRDATGFPHMEYHVDPESFALSVRTVAGGWG